MLNYTQEQITAMAPDPASVSAGKKLSGARDWKTRGISDLALWGECQGSALYQVKIDLGQFGYNCSCPSRKLPCKHVLGLLYLAQGSPKEVAEGTPPEWVNDWLAKRGARAEKKEAKAKEEATKPVDAEAQARRAEQRSNRVGDGIDRLDLWLEDIIRSGLAGLERQPPSFWEEQAKRLIDSQAPALAARIRRIGEMVGIGKNWPELIFEQLSRVALITHAYKRMDQLSPTLQQEVRSMVGWTISQEELANVGTKVTDHWQVLSQRVEEEERLKVQRTWLLGQKTQQFALILQFSVAGTPFPETIIPGMRFDGELLFWPGATLSRAKLGTKPAEMAPLQSISQALTSIDQLHQRMKSELAANPWSDRFPVVLENVIPLPSEEEQWQLKDHQNQLLPLTRPAPWKLLALSGGEPITLCGEWNGSTLLPLSVIANQQFHLLGA